MTSAVALSLLSSLTLFLGLTALARQRALGKRSSVRGLLLSLLGVLGTLWLIVLGEWRSLAPVLLIGALGYCFGHFTTPHREDTPKSSPSSQLP